MNRKKIIAGWTALAAAAILGTGCGDENRFLRIDTPVFDVGSEAQQLTTAISASSVWMAGLTEDWITVAISEDRSSVTLSILQNSEEAERSGSVPIVTGDGQEQTIVVNQSGFDVVFNINPATLAEFPGTGGSQTISVETNVEWGVTYAELWLSFVQDPGGAAQFTVTAARNTDLAERRTTFTVGPTYANFEAYIITLEVVQQGAQIAIHNEEYINTGRMAAPAEGGDIVVYLVAASDWQVTDDGGLAVAPASGGATGSDEAEITVTVPPNETDQQAAYTVVFSCNGEELALEIIQPGITPEEPVEP